ncbi:DUF3187 family protein [Vibrio lentus]|nr:DUF3187 family protein [Vibrio lentus]
MQSSAVEISIIENIFNMDNSTDVAFQLTIVIEEIMVNTRFKVKE